MHIEILYERSNVGSKASLQEEEQLGVLWGHIKIKWKDGIIILTAGGISKLLIKRLNILEVYWFFPGTWRSFDCMVLFLNVILKAR